MGKCLKPVFHKSLFNKNLERLALAFFVSSHSIHFICTPPIFAMFF